MTDTDRDRPNIVRHGNVVNHSQRTNGSRVELIVLHDTESHNRPGNADLNAIYDWFDNPSAQVSCHVVVDGDGNSVVCVDSALKAWHVAHYNSAAVGIEQIGFSTDTQPTWDARPNELHEAARWVARWSLMYHIPLVRAEVYNGAVIRAGVITHKELGALGGGHNDPGVGYPFNHVLDLAVGYRARLIGG